MAEYANAGVCGQTVGRRIPANVTDDSGDRDRRRGMSPQHLSEIESGKRDPRLSSIERVAEAMGMTVLS